jgi:hypothetical protein
MRIEGPRRGYQSLQLAVLLCIAAETGDHATNSTGWTVANTDILTHRSGACDGRCRCGSPLCAETSRTADSPVRELERSRPRAR